MQISTKLKAVSADSKLPVFTIGAAIFILGVVAGGSAWATSIDHTLRQHTEVLREISSNLKTVVGQVYTNSTNIAVINSEKVKLK